MIKLSLDDLGKLLRILEKMPIMGEYESRRQILISAGLQQIIPQINLQGIPFVVVSSIVEVLAQYGRVTFEHEALGRLLNRLKEFIGADDETQAFFDYLLLHYDMMIPTTRLKAPTQWKSNCTSQDVFEKIIGENSLKNIAFLERGLEVASAITYIEVANRWSGTGFMISPDLLITNNHVLPHQKYLATTTFRFNYQLTFDGSTQIVKDYHAKQGGLFYTNSALDYAIIELDGCPGKEWGYLPLSCTSILAKGSRANIIGHPAGLPKQISLQNNIVAYADAKIVQYHTSTLGGSSGSPVFNDKWQVAAIHHAGGMLCEPDSAQQYFRNEGITIAAIVSDCPQTIKQKLKLVRP